MTIGIFLGIFRVQCTNCDGSGLAGAGDKPWLHQGAVKTCTQCSGTGTFPESPLPQEASTDNVPKEDGASASETGSQDAAPKEQTVPSDGTEPIAPQN